MEENSKQISYKSIFGPKLIVKELLEYFSISHIAKLEVLNKFLNEKFRSTYLSCYDNVEIIASEFMDIDKFLNFIYWYEQRINENPSSFFLCINSYHMKDQICEKFRNEFLQSMEKLFLKMTQNCKQLRSLRINMVRQHGEKVNDSMCNLIVPLLDQIVRFEQERSDEVFLENVQIQSTANSEMIRLICMLENLRILKITNCSYLTGEFLQNLKSKKLSTLDFSSSYQIEYDQILQCVLNNSATIDTLYLDGEYMRSEQFNKLIENLHDIKEFGIFFGNKIKDKFLINLTAVVSHQLLHKLLIRKAQKLNNTAFEHFFTAKLPSLRYLRLDDCRQLLDSSVVLISQNCSNLRSLSLNWCQLLQDDGVSSILVKCKELKKLNLIGLKKLQDQAFEAALQIEKDLSTQNMAPRTALDSLKKLNLSECDYVNDSLLFKIKRNHQSMRIINYYKEEVE
eukprot:403342172